MRSCLQSFVSALPPCVNAAARRAQVKGLHAALQIVVVVWDVWCMTTRAYTPVKLNVRAELPLPFLCLLGYAVQGTCCAP